MQAFRILNAIVKAWFLLSPKSDCKVRKYLPEEGEQGCGHGFICLEKVNVRLSAF